MTSWISSGIRPRLGSALDSQLDFLEGPLGPQGRRLFDSLKKERSPEFFYTGLLHLGRRLENDGELPAAAQLYQFLQKTAGVPPPSDAVKREAGLRLEALNEGGSWGARVERGASAFFRETILSPEMLLFAAARPAFGLARVKALSWLAARPGINFLTRGLGRKILGQAAGIFVESFVLTAGGEALSRLRTDRPSAGWEETGRNLASNLILSGAMRLASFSAHPAGLFAGITLGRYLETAVGLREPGDLAQLLGESFSTYLHAYIGGSLSRGLLGKEWQLREAAWNRWQPQETAPSGFRVAVPASAAATVRAKIAGNRPAESDPLRTQVFRIFGSEKTETRSPASAEPSVLPTLKFLDRQSRNLPPQRAIPHLNRTALLLHEAGLPHAAQSVLLKAREQILNMASADNLPHFYAVAETAAKMGDRETASRALAVARECIDQMHPERRPAAFGELAWHSARIGDEPSASYYLEVAEEALSTISPQNQGPIRESLAGYAASAGDLKRAQYFIHETPVGKRVYAWGRLAGCLAKIFTETQRAEFYEGALAAFQAAKADLEIVTEPAGYWADRCLRLLHATLDAGPFYRPLAVAWADEFQSLFAEKLSELSDLSCLVPELVHVLARSGELTSAKRWLDQFSLAPEERSKAVRNLAIAMLETGVYQEALDFLENERLYPAHRFEALLGIANTFDAGNPAQLSPLRSILLQARQVVLQSEFDGQMYRSQALLQLAERLQYAGAELSELQDILDRVPAAFQSEMYGDRWVDAQNGNAEWARQRFRILVLPQLRADIPDLFGKLFTTAKAGNIPGMRKAALLLGFRPNGMEHALHHLSLFHPQWTAWIQAWLYYGATFLPRPEESETSLAHRLQDFILAGFSAEGGQNESPLALKSQTVGIQALHRISPNLLQTTLMPTIRSRIETAESRIWPGHAGWLSSLAFSASDRLLFQALRYIARHGSAANQSFVGEILKAPTLPPEWKNPLERILRYSGFLFIESTPAWN